MATAPSTKKASAAKAPAKAASPKASAKKAAPAKTTAKTTAKKTAAKPAAAKKTTAAKAPAKKAAAKAPAKKSAATKTAAAKKPAAKSAAKSAAAKKPAAKKTAAKPAKPAAKAGAKPAAKAGAKPAGKKPAAGKAKAAAPLRSSATAVALRRSRMNGPMPDVTYDRAAEDLGNIVGLEHINIRVPDQRLATLFYITGLGMTRDPYLVTSTANMWINMGSSQCHLPTGEAQVLRGHTGVVVPDLDALIARLEMVAPQLAGTRFAFRREAGHVDVTCPWGNHFRCHAPNEQRFGGITLGIPYVEFDVPAGTADGIVRFYDTVFGAPGRVAQEHGGKVARIKAGQQQELVYRETERSLPDYDGHHLAVYVRDFSGPHRRLLERSLVTEESDQHQYRFLDIVDPATGAKLFTIEHEVRSMRHPLYARPMVNRDPTQTNRDYAPGYDAWVWSTEHAH